MRVLIGGVEHKKHVTDCVGYSATDISLGASDLRTLAELSPRDLYATIAQLSFRVRDEARFVVVTPPG